MALNTGLRASELRDYHSLLCSHHTVDIRLRLLNLDHVQLGGELSTRLVDGQVTVDASADVSRGLDLDLLDPTHALHLDSDSPNDGALFGNRMLQVRYSVVNPMKTQRYTCAVFTGPITKLERTGSLLKVEAQGKEVFGLSEAWNEHTFKKGMRVTYAIQYIVHEMMGEQYRHMHIPKLRRKLPRNVSVGGDKLPWKVAKNLAHSIGYHLFYDGRGTCQMRKMPTRKSFTFHEGRGGSIKTEPDIGFSLENVVNAVEVYGTKPKKTKGKTQKKRPHSRMVAAKSHPFSPWKLGRNGGPRFIPITIEDDGIRNNAQAQDRARERLRRGLLESVDVAYDTLVIPYLEENDVVRCSTEKWAGNHRLRAFAIPLRAGGDMTVGYVRNVKVATFRVKWSRVRKRNRRR